MVDRPKRRGKVGVRPTHGPIVSAILDAQDAYRSAVKAGTPLDAVEAQIADGLRTVLQRGVWHPRCAKCSDTGWYEIRVDVRSIYGPDAALQAGVEKCTVCGYWDRVWQKYC